MIFKFLWGGFHKQSGKCHYKVGWLDCCKPKAEGGLGLKNILDLNRSSVLYQLWRIIQPDASSLWVKWVHNSLLKGKSFWTTKIPYKCPWSFRQILNHRRIASVYIRYTVGRNSSFLFWLDPYNLDQISSLLLSPTSLLRLVNSLRAVRGYCLDLIMPT